MHIMNRQIVLCNNTQLHIISIEILSKEKTGRIDTKNPSVEELLAYTSSEIVGKNLDELVTGPSGHPLPISARQAHTAVAKCRNNKILPVQITFSELRTKGQILYTGFLRDITVDVQIRETLPRAH